MGRYIYHGVEFAKKLTADEQRSFSMLVRNKSWGGKIAKTNIAEQIVPVETVKPKLTVVYDSKSSGGKTKATKKAKASWDAIKENWDATRESGELTCSCGKVFAALGSSDKGGALFHRNWTTLSGLYGARKDHYIPTIK